MIRHDITQPRKTPQVKQKGKAHTVFGVDAPGPKLTRRGGWLIAGVVVLPILAALLALDIIGFVIARFVFDACYGVLCLLN